MSFATPVWDMAAFVWINQTARHGLLDAVMPVLSQKKWLWLLIGAILAAILKRADARRLLPLLYLLAVVGITDMSASMLKDFFGRLRPMDTLTETYHLEDGRWSQRPEAFQQASERGSSFPSAHAANSMAAATILIASMRKPRPWMLSLPLLVGYSRVYLGKHYPSDVLAGWLLGLGLAMIFTPFLLSIRAWASSGSKRHPRLYTQCASWLSGLSHRHPKGCRVFLFPARKAPLPTISRSDPAITHGAKFSGRLGILKDRQLPQHPVDDGDCATAPESDGRGAP